MGVATLGRASDPPRPLTEHLTDLRRVLIISGAAWLGASTLAFAFHGFLLGVLTEPLHRVLEHGQHLTTTAIFTSPTEGLTIPMSISMGAGVILSLPVILWQVWSFVKPALARNERRLAAPLLVSALSLFAVGAGFAYIVLPLGLGFLSTFLSGSATYLPDLSSYLSFFALVVLVFGVTFELPVAVVLLGLLGIVNSRVLATHRRGIWLGIILVALVVTPGADPFTPTALAIPLLCLFELSVVILRKPLHR